ncbi:MAG: IS3 family transposase [Arachidicoccus sp.]|nr:IS3 family transposase [Arachidicoccus sp.]
MCKVLQVSKSCYYKWLLSPQSIRRSRQLSMKEKINKIYEDSRRRYGSPGIAAQLHNEEIVITNKTVAKYMHQMGLRSIRWQEILPHHHR